jgi:hypothetical protein
MQDKKSGNPKTTRTGKAAGALIALIFMVQFLTPLCSGQELSGIPRTLKSPQDLEKWLSGFKSKMQLPDMPQTVKEMLITRVGDCDDFAILASKALAGLGISSTVLVIKFKGTPIRHAICVWKDENGNHNFFSAKRLVQTKKKSMDDVVKRYYPYFESVSVMDARERGGF